jgi:hypothetical protein
MNLNRGEDRPCTEHLPLRDRSHRQDTAHTRKTHRLSAELCGSLRHGCERSHSIRSLPTSHVRSPIAVAKPVPDKHSPSSTHTAAPTTPAIAPCHPSHCTCPSDRPQPQTNIPTPSMGMCANGQMIQARCNLCRLHHAGSRPRANPAKTATLGRSHIQW